MDRKYIRNTAILFASMTITKIVGAVFKIPLANVLGGTGMGYFSTAYGLYSPVFALTAAGIPTVMMRLTAQNIAANRPGNAVKTRRTALLLFSAIGALGTLLVAIFSVFFAERIACSPESAPAVIAIAPAVMICCVASVIRGYHEGMSDVVPSSAAAVAEAVSRAVVGLTAAYGVVFRAKNRFECGLDILGRHYADYSEAYSAILPVAAAGAVAAVSVSELCGLISLLISDKRRRLKVPAGEQTDRSLTITRRLIREIIPVAASALVMNCVSFVDLLTVTRTLQNAVAADSAYFIGNYGAIIAECGADGLANFMYGSYTGVAMTVFMLIPSFAGMTEKTALPEIAAAWERRDVPAAVQHCCTMFRAAASIGFPACLGAAAVGEPLLLTLYSRRAAEVSVCSGAFTILCLGGMFMIIASAMFGVFQAIGKAHVPLILMSFSVGIKALLNPILMSVPQLNISGAALATAIGYVFMSVTGALLLKKLLSPCVNVVSCVWRPFLGALACAACAHVVYSLMNSHVGNLICVAVSVVSGAFVYGISLIINSDFRKNRRLTKHPAFFSQKHLKNPQK